jgi:hypothetical protein
MDFARKLLLYTMFVMGLASPAAAQIIPPSEQPGREQFRFQQPAVPRAQQRGALIQLPSTGVPAARPRFHSAWTL